MDQQNLPWGERIPVPFSPQALAAAPSPVMHAYPYWDGAVKYGGPMDPPNIKLLAAKAALIINRGLRTLRRALNLAFKWNIIDKPVKVELAKGEVQRDRVLSATELNAYLSKCQQP